MVRKGLILYVSITGNTQKIAMTFKETMEREDWKVDAVRLTGKTDFESESVYFDDYDLVLLGSPIMAGLPSPLLGKHLGLTGSMPPRLYRNKMVMPGLLAPEKSPYAVVFGTYAGMDAGPLEALPTLAIEKLYLQNLYCTVIGQFICPGKEARHAAVDELSDNTGLSVEVASDVLGRYLEDPDAEEFRSMPPHELGKIKAAAGVEDKGEAGMPRPPEEMAHMSEDEFKAVIMANEKRIGGHYDIFNRPNDRDLLKAELYIEEVVKDHFPKDLEERHPFGGEYIMIS